MNPNSQSDNYVFNFATDFVPKDLEDKWKIHLKNYRKPYSSVLDYVNSNIKSVLMPGISIPTVVQKKLYGKETNYRSSKSPYDISSRELQVIMRNTDYNIFYYILEDIITYHYLKNNKPFIPDFTVIILDVNRREQLKVVFKELLFIGLSDIKFSHEDKEVAEHPITLSFKYNIKDTEYIPKWDSGTVSGEVYDEYSTVLLRNDDSVPRTPPNETLDSDDDVIIGS